MKVLKFGGSSVAHSERIQGVVSICTDSNRYAPDTVRAVVVSAFQGITDTLIRCAGLAKVKNDDYRALVQEIETRHLTAAHDLVPVTNRSSVLASIKVLLNDLRDVLHGVSLVGECTARTLDLVMSFGERLSALVVCEAFRAAGSEAEILDARRVIITDDSFGNARPVADVTRHAIREYLHNHKGLQIVTGFIGSTSDGATTTLGRGGSDFTASIIGSAIDAESVEIWTDVDGMLTADPRKVSKAFPIPAITFEEAMELCHFGAKVIYPPTMQPVIDAGIPLVIKNTLNPSAPGTRIQTLPSQHPFPITGISSISAVALVRIQGSGMIGVSGVAMRFFRALAARNINVILITQASSEHTICCAIDPASIRKARAAVDDEFGLEIKAGMVDPLVIEEDVSIVSVVGERMRQSPGISGRVFTALGSNGVNVIAIAQGSSELNISAVVPSRDETKALNALHDEFFVSSSKTLNLWIAGTGLVGQTLLKQLAEQAPTLVNDCGLDVKIRGIANSRNMRLGVDSALDPLSPLDGTDTQFEADTFFSHIVSSNLANCVFVDCTASDELPPRYTQLLDRSIAIVTPNKRGISGKLSLYKTLKSAAQRRRTPFFHETSVGAALPVLNTLSDLTRSGDRIHRIEAVLSGTLSYIFNTLSDSTPFSQAVLDAKARGYTEPDPRDDLSGMDVARKVLILARESGLEIEFEDIDRSPLLPAEAMEWTLDEFMRRLPELDGHFEDLRSSAQSRSERLFFSASIDCRERRATMGLMSVPLSHPFCALQGSDNIVSFTSSRYATQPLVVKGPGAGAEVTAAGVFADIIRTGR